MKTNIETAWYKYAKSVVCINAQHRRDCENSTGASGTPALNPAIRWPGYIGSNYASSALRLLCVGQVHHASMLLDTLGYIQPDLQRIARSKDDAHLMSAITAAYEGAMPLWGPWTKFRKILSPLGLNQTHIAYTNVAKCWQTLSDNPDCKYPMRACAGVFPINMLAHAIESHAIIIMSAESTLRYAGIKQDGIPMFSFPGRPSDAHLASIAQALQQQFDRIAASR